MALANIFIKIQEIEKKLESLYGVSSISSSPVITDMSDIYNRLSALENNTQSQLIQQLTERIAVLEQRQVDDKIAQVDAKVAQLETVFLDKLTHIESVIITDLRARVDILELKMDTSV